MVLATMKNVLQFFAPCLHLPVEEFLFSSNVNYSERCNMIDFTKDDGP